MDGYDAWKQTEIHVNQDISMKNRQLQTQIEGLEILVERLLTCKTADEKCSILDAEPLLKAFFHEHPVLKDQVNSLSSEDQMVVKSLLAIGQGPFAFYGLESIQPMQEGFQSFLNQLREVEKFYDTIGGIPGYDLTVLKLVLEQENEGSIPSSNNLRYLMPEGIDLTSNDDEVRSMILTGIEHLDEMVEIYPVGGAGDRLMLRDEERDRFLPAACLQFAGRTLLEGLIRDLEGREYLYYKLYGKRIETPIAMMTSVEKNNHAHMQSICKKNHWFGRSPDSFFFFTQPLAPMISKEGEWCFSAPLKPILKPGGHGVMWKLALDSGVFDWIEKKQRSKALVRQINNPIAGTDSGLLALFGAGYKGKKAFGFASCPRLLQAAEGMNVLVERKIGNIFAYSISNVEYVEFAKRGIKDVPEYTGSPYSAFPANTNLLFVDLAAVREAVPLCPLPGMLINMKNKVNAIDSYGLLHEVEAGRLESTMQNIADVLVDTFSHPIKPEEYQQLSTFVTYNKRSKTISVTKKAYTPGKGMAETPEGCFYDILSNHQALFSNDCFFSLPTWSSPEEYLKNCPSTLILFHPALGPLYSIIGQKIRGGSLAEGAELQLEIAEADISELHVEGSLLILADVVVGDSVGKCELHRVKVVNRGIDRSQTSSYWTNQIKRHEALTIILHGNGEFCAEDVVFEGGETLDVPAGHRMVAYMQGSDVGYRLENIEKPTWEWSYAVDEEKRIVLRKS